VAAFTVGRAHDDEVEDAEKCIGSLLSKNRIVFLRIGQTVSTISRCEGLNCQPQESFAYGVPDSRPLAIEVCRD
jgi:hypothetical protein